MKAIDIINQWNAMTGEDQFKFCENCVKLAIKQGRRLKPGYEFCDAAQDTAERVLKVLANPAKLDADTERRESQGKAGNTLAAIVCRAANNSMANISYHGGKHSKATRRKITAEDGYEIDVLDTVASKGSTEDAAITRVILKDFYSGLDSTDQIIFDGMARGMTEREIAPAVGVSYVAVHKRITKLRTALASLFQG